MGSVVPEAFSLIGLGNLRWDVTSNHLLLENTISTTSNTTIDTTNTTNITTTPRPCVLSSLVDTSVQKVPPKPCDSNGYTNLY